MNNKPINLDKEDKEWYLIYRPKSPVGPVFQYTKHILNFKKELIHVIAGPDSKYNLWDIGSDWEKNFLNKGEINGPES